MSMTVALLLLTFIIFIVYIFKGGNMMVGFFVMALLWTVIGRISLHTAVNDIFSQSVLDYGATIVQIVFGSWFGRVLVDSGIAASISRAAAKFGRGRIMLTAIAVVLVTAVIFSSAYGAGSVLAVGVIILPILLELGMPKQVALTTFLLSVGSTLYINLVLFKQIQGFFPKADYAGSYLIFAGSAVAVQLVAIVIYLLINQHKFTPEQAELNRIEFKLDQGGDQAVEKVVNPISWLVPLVPVVLSIAFQMPAVPALTIAGLLAMLLTGEFTRGYDRFQNFLDNSIKRGVGDISGLIMFLLVLMMFQGAAKANAAAFVPLFEAIVPHSTLVLALALGILAPLALARGPLMVFGAGAATVAVLSGLNIFPDSVLLPLLYVPTVMAMSTDITQSWNVWGMGYLDVKPNELIKNGVPVMWVVTIINEVLVWFIIGK
ncbi:gluconate:proton symporter [Weissella soli]|uniref:gluconate:proton symporter n=1 Tax=Weissella soli TaxID=155866 RepID=UPI0035A1843E